MKLLLLCILFAGAARADDQDKKALQLLADDLNKLGDPTHRGSLSLWIEVAGPRAEKVRAASADLIRSLADRDRHTLDLVVVGKKLVQRHGLLAAYLAVHLAWATLTPAHESYATDAMWLFTQVPRVRDVAWLLSFESEWCLVRVSGQVNESGVNTVVHPKFIVEPNANAVRR